MSMGWGVYSSWPRFIIFPLFYLFCNWCRVAIILIIIWYTRYHIGVVVGCCELKTSTDQSVDGLDVILDLGLDDELTSLW